MRFTALRASYNFRLEPVAKGRPRVTTRGGQPRTYTPEKTVAFEEEIANAAYYQHVAQNYPELTGRLALDAAFYVSNRRNDIDNYGKAILDGIQLVKKLYGHALFQNDSQFDWVSFRRFYVPKGHEGITTTITGVEGNGHKKLDYEGPF